MAKYLVLYHADVGAEEQMQQSEEDSQADTQAWTDWAAGVGPALVDFGSPLGQVCEVTVDGTSTPSTTVGGYSIVEADDVDGAAALMTGHPHLQIGTIRLHEALDVPGM